MINDSSVQIKIKYTQKQVSGIYEICPVIFKDWLQSSFIVLNKKVTKLEYANLIKYEANLNSAVKQL